MNHNKNKFTKWVSFWGNAMSIGEHMPEGYSKNISLRYPVYAPFSGDSLRFTFDNYCGTEPVSITYASVAYAGNSDRELIPDTLQKITFGGVSSVLIPPSGQAISDPVTFEVNAGKTLNVTFYLENYTQMRSCVLIKGPLSKGFYSIGNQIEAPLLPLDATRTTNWFYFLNNIEIHTTSDKKAVICYGDSITAQSWPDYLSLFYKKESRQNHCEANTAVIRRAASGTRVLREYTCLTYESYGLKGSHRFLHEIPVSGSEKIIIQQGINDIIHPVGTAVNPFRPMEDLPTADELIQGLCYYIKESRRAGLKVYMGTLLPIWGWRTYASFRENLKNEVNDWIRNTPLIDGCIDFDLTVRDSIHPAAFKAGFDSGDHLHPSEAAYEEMARAAHLFIK